MKVIINPKYNALENFIKNLPSRFEKLTEYELLRNGRNRIVRCRVDGYGLVIKSYGNPSFINSIVYGTLRQSKAMRAYYNAMRLLQLGINTPEPIASVEERRYGRLASSYFVSLDSGYTPLPAKAPYCSKDFCQMLDSLASFIIRLHDLGIIHNDLNPSNILYRRDESNGGYEFQIVDNNRMRFKSRLTLQDRFNDLRHFSSDDMPYLCMLHRYATLLDVERREVNELRGVIARYKLLMRSNMKDKIKGKISLKL